jgi:hypothetical protein
MLRSRGCSIPALATPVLKPMLPVGCAIYHAWIRAASVVASCSP